MYVETGAPKNTSQVGLTPVGASVSSSGPNPEPAEVLEKTNLIQWALLWALGECGWWGQALWMFPRGASFDDVQKD